MAVMVFCGGRAGRCCRGGGGPCLAHAGQAQQVLGGGVEPFQHHPDRLEGVGDAFPHADRKAFDEADQEFRAGAADDLGDLVRNQLLDLVAGCPQGAEEGHHAGFEQRPQHAEGGHLGNRLEGGDGDVEEEVENRDLHAGRQRPPRPAGKDHRDQHRAGDGQDQAADDFLVRRQEVGDLGGRRLDRGEGVASALLDVGNQALQALPGLVEQIVGVADEGQAGNRTHHVQHAGGQRRDLFGKPVEPALKHALEAIHAAGQAFQHAADVFRRLADLGRVEAVFPYPLGGLHELRAVLDDGVDLAHRHQQR